MSKTIKEKHMKDCYNAAEDNKKAYLLDKLTTHHRLLYNFIREKKAVYSMKLL